MRTRIVVLLLACGLGGCAQPRPYEEKSEDGRTTKEGHLARGRQEGEWTFYHESGAKKATGRYRSDLQDGLWTYWHENGQKEMEGAFVDERRSGLWRYWYEDGSPKAEGRFEADQEIGYWTFWSPSGAKARCGDFVRGRLTHRWRYFYENGQPQAEGLYLNGARVGVWTFWDVRGREVRKSAPLPDGYDLVEEHWPGGGRRREGFLRDGQPVGRWVTTHRSGERRISGDFQDGLPHGIWEAWSGDGARLAAGPVERGRMKGEWEAWVGGERRSFRPEAIRTPAPRGGEWSDAALAREEPAESVARTWMAEACAPVGEQMPEELFKGDALEDEAIDDPGAPTVGVYVDFTVEQKEKLETIARAYEEGTPLYSRSGNLPGFSFHRGGPSYVELRGGQEGDAEAAASIAGKPLPLTELRGVGGDVVDLDTYRGRRNVLLVILRGFDGRVCEYCAGQTLALGRNRSEFEQRDTEVLVVYPGRRSRLDGFVEAYRRQFQQRSPRVGFLYDPELELADELGIGPPEGKLAKPTVLLIDKSGSVAFAYVGTRREDRPSVKKILEEIDKLK